MKIFISWSGELSRKVAVDLKDWLKCVLQGVDPFVSSEDIRKGQRWAFEVAKELEESNFGILCLTKDNLNAPWILFEAGALSKFMKETNVSALLINGIKMSDVTGPLSQFQHTNTTKQDFQKLILTINETMEQEKLEDETIKKVFEKWWPDLESKIHSNIESTKFESSEFEQRSERDMLIETLELARFLANRSTGPSDLEQLLKNLSTNTNELRTSDGVVVSPSGGEYNHPSEVEIYPVPVRKDGKTEKLVSVKVSSTGVKITEIDPPSGTRGVIIILTFWSETEGRYWEAKFQFHKGNTLIETKINEKQAHETDGAFSYDVIWRD